MTAPYGFLGGFAAANGKPTPLNAPVRTSRGEMQPFPHAGLVQVPRRIPTPEISATVLRMLQVLLGGALTIAGGFFAAWWQTRRADDVARRVRRSERREQALFALHSKAAETYDALASMHRVAVTGQMDSSQYSASRTFLARLSELWLWECAAIVGDGPITDLYAVLDEVARDRLPENGHDALDRYLAAYGDEAGERFASDLGYVLGLLGEFRNAIRRQLDQLLPPKATRSLWKSVSARLVAGRPAKVEVAATGVVPPDAP